LIWLRGLSGKEWVVVRKTKALLMTVSVASALCAQGAGVAAGGPGVANQADVGVKQRSTLTPQEMSKQANEYFKSMNDTLKRISGLQEQSKRQKDIIRLNCVTDKLVQAKVNITIGEQAMASLQENITRADEGGRTHEFTRLTIVNQKVAVLGAEAENCIGEDLSFVGATRVDVEIDPSLPQTDITQPGVPTTDVVRPDYASDTQGG